MTVDETGVDETVVDETGVDELGINQANYLVSLQPLSLGSALIGLRC